MTVHFQLPFCTVLSRLSREGSDSGSVCACHAAALGSIPVARGEACRDLFLAFNIGDCVSLVARMTTYMGCQVGQVVSLLGLGTVVQSL